MATSGRVTAGSRAGKFMVALAEEEDNRVSRLVAEMRRDAYVSLVDRVLTSNMKSAQVTVTTGSEDQRTRILAATLETIWFRHIRQFSDAFAYGRVAHEIVWAALPKAGLDVVSSLIPLPYDKTTLTLSKDGDFDGIDFEVGEKEPFHLDPLYSWWLSIDSTPLELHGRSRYLGAMHEAWKERKDALQRRKTFIRKYALGDITFEGPQFEMRDGKQVDVWAEFAASANGAEAGDVLCMDPGEVESEGQARPKYKVTKDPIPAKDGTPLLVIADKLGEEVLLAAGVPPKTVVEGDAVGSFALVTQQMLILLATVEDLLSQTGESFQKNIVDKARTLNGTDSIQWNYTPLTQRKDDLAIEIVRSWMTTPQLSPMVTSGAVDIPALLNGAGIPVSKDLMSRLDGMIQTARESTQSAQLTFDLWNKQGVGI